MAVVVQLVKGGESGSGKYRQRQSGNPARHRFGQPAGSGWGGIWDSRHADGPGTVSGDRQRLELPGAPRPQWHIAEQYGHVRIQYRTPSQLGPLERFHQILKTKEVWRL